MIDWLNIVCKWRTLFAGWQLGTRPKGEPEADAVRDHREVTILLRVECSAFSRILIEKGICTSEEFFEILQEEARELSLLFEKRFPGVKAVVDGLQIDAPRAAETMRGWKP